MKPTKLQKVGCFVVQKQHKSINIHLLKWNLIEWDNFDTQLAMQNNRSDCNPDIEIMTPGCVQKQWIVRLDWEDLLDDVVLKGSTYAIEQRNGSRDLDFDGDDNVISKIFILGTVFSDV
jgi:hypothetical protein